MGEFCVGLMIDPKELLTPKVLGIFFVEVAKKIASLESKVKIKRRECLGQF